MAEQYLYDQLNAGVEAIIAKRAAAPPAVDPSIAELLRIAVDLRGLPREAFKTQLNTQLMRRGSMTTPAKTVEEQAPVKPIPEGFRSITPYLMVKRAPELIDFLKQAFGAPRFSAPPDPRRPARRGSRRRLDDDDRGGCLDDSRNAGLAPPLRP